MNELVERISSHEISLRSVNINIFPFAPFPLTPPPPPRLPSSFLLFDHLFLLLPCNSQAE